MNITKCSKCNCKIYIGKSSCNPRELGVLHLKSNTYVCQPCFEGLCFTDQLDDDDQPKPEPEPEPEPEPTTQRLMQCTQCKQSYPFNLHNCTHCNCPNPMMIRKQKKRKRKNKHK